MVAQAAPRERDGGTRSVAVRRAAKDQRYDAPPRRSGNQELGEVMKTHEKLCGGKFSVEMEVTGSGEPLLFLHGAGGLTGADPFLEDLGRSFKVYAPHLPGYGESTGGEHIDDVI